MRWARRPPRALVPRAPKAPGAFATPLGPTAAPRRAPEEAWEGARGGGDGLHGLGSVGKRRSPWQGSSCCRLEVAGGFWPLQNSKHCPQRGLSRTAKRHYATSAAGICGGARKTRAALPQVHAVFPLGGPHVLLCVTPYSLISFLPERYSSDVPGLSS